MKFNFCFLIFTSFITETLLKNTFKGEYILRVGNCPIIFTLSYEGGSQTLPKTFTKKFYWWTNDRIPNLREEPYFIVMTDKSQLPTFQKYVIHTNTSFIVPKNTGGFNLGYFTKQYSTFSIEDFDFFKNKTEYYSMSYATISFPYFELSINWIVNILYIIIFLCGLFYFGTWVILSMVKKIRILYPKYLMSFAILVIVCQCLLSFLGADYQEEEYELPSGKRAIYFLSLNFILKTLIFCMLFTFARGYQFLKPMTSGTKIRVLLSKDFLLVLAPLSIIYLFNLFQLLRFPKKKYKYSYSIEYSIFLVFFIIHSMKTKSAITSLPTLLKKEEMSFLRIFNEVIDVKAKVFLHFIYITCIYCCIKIIFPWVEYNYLKRGTISYDVFSAVGEIIIDTLFIFTFMLTFCKRKMSPIKNAKPQYSDTQIADFKNSINGSGKDIELEVFGIQSDALNIDFANIEIFKEWN